MPSKKLNQGLTSDSECGAEKSSSDKDVEVIVPHKIKKFIAKQDKAKESILEPVKVDIKIKDKPKEEVKAESKKTNKPKWDEVQLNTEDVKYICKYMSMMVDDTITKVKALRSSDNKVMISRDTKDADTKLYIVKDDKAVKICYKADKQAKAQYATVLNDKIKTIFNGIK